MNALSKDVHANNKIIRSYEEGMIHIAVVVSPGKELIISAPLAFAGVWSMA